MSSILPALTRPHCLPDHAGRMAVSISVVEHCWHDVCNYVYCSEFYSRHDVLRSFVQRLQSKAVFAPCAEGCSQHKHPNLRAGNSAKTTARGNGLLSGRSADYSAFPPADPDVRNSRIRLLVHHHSLPVLLSLCRAGLVRPFVGSKVRPVVRRTAR